MRIGGFVDMSTVDWYGNVSFVVFFAGCNFRCPYCQNSGLIPLDSGEEVELEAVRRRIEMNLSPVPELDAVVLTGGEPLIQHEAAVEVAKLARDLDLKLMLDTNGSVPGSVEPLLEAGLLGDAGTIIEGIRGTHALCERYGVEVEARTTIAPTVSDEIDFIRQIANEVKGRCDCYYLQQFDNTGDVLSPELKTSSPPARERMLDLAEAALEEGVGNVYIKTRAFGLERVG